ncbi:MULTISPECIES: hypothetical protein [unclassified Blastococcus]|nr:MULTISPECIES: hypothetical protein [unclassified Blastococcus]
MQLVARVEKVDPPSRTAVCRAAAVAVVRLLSDDRALPGGEWAADVDRWLTGGVRKLCRRARGAAWERVQAVAGITAVVAGAEVRALVPRSTVRTPSAIGRLPLTGREPADPDAAAAIDPRPSGSVVVSICPDPSLSLGKACAAAGHAAQLVAMRMPADRLTLWRSARFPVLVEHPDVERWQHLRLHSQVEVLDSGLTEVPLDTCTALARWA